MHPAHIDGRSLVVIHRTALGYRASESGLLVHDGKSFDLEGDHGSRQISDDELSQLQPVVPGNRIAACHGFDFFLLTEGP